MQTTIVRNILYKAVSLYSVNLGTLGKKRKTNKVEPKEVGRV